MMTGRGNPKKLEEKPDPVPFFPQQIPHAVIQN
jgi:hypothetical protein